jgi:hypothetical protein
MAKASKKAPARKTKPQDAKPAKTPKAAKATKPTKSREPKATSKSAAILGLLTRTSGATIAELAEATGWQAHSVRGFMSGTLRKKQALELDNERVDGVRRYRIAKAQ